MTMLPPLGHLDLPSRRKGLRAAPPGWAGLAHAPSPVLSVEAGDLWRIWIEFAASQPRTSSVALDEDARRSLHLQRSRLFRFPDEVRAEIVATENGCASLLLDSRARYGGYDFGVNAARVSSWLAELQQAVQKRQPGC
jgi:uncharacterized protein (DUF1499 family)